MENDSPKKALTGAGKKYMRIYRRSLCLPGGKRRQAIRELREKLGDQQDYKALTAALGTPENAALARNRSEDGVIYRKSPGRIPCLILGWLGVVGLIWPFLLRLIAGLTLKAGEMIPPAASVGIIGGADGPTAIYVAGQPHPLLQAIPCLLIAVIGFLGWYRLRYWKEKL